MEDRNSYVSIALATIVGIILSRLSIGGLFMTVPALILASRLRNTKMALIPIVMMMIGVVLWNVIDCRSILSEPDGPGVLVLSVFLPVSSMMGGFCWIVSREKSNSMMRRLFLTSIPVVMLGTGVALWFSTSAAQGLKTTIESVMSSFFQLQSLSYDVETMSEMVMVVLMMCFSFLGMVSSGIPIIISEMTVHKNDQDWQAEFAWMKFPDNYVWLFIGAWVLALLSSIITSVPAWLMAIGWNVALPLSVLYGVQGLSIIVSLLRKRNPMVLANRVVFLAIILLLLPGVNVVVAIGLPVLGALESWIRFR